MIRSMVGGVTAVISVAIAVVAIGYAAGNLRAELMELPLTADLGGATSRVIGTEKAFTFLASNGPSERQRPFFFGNRLFNTNWTVAPASVNAFDGLGPTYNRVSCSGCHVFDGRGRPPVVEGELMTSMLVRLSLPNDEGVPEPHPAYGDQLNDRAILGVKPEGRAVIDYEKIAGSYGDGTPYSLLKPSVHFEELAYGSLDGALLSARVAPAVIGLGLLESVPVETLEALSDPDDADGDGISGRINWLIGSNGESRAGRFGWKANVPTLREQGAGAASGDIGITSSLFPEQNCPAAQVDCAGVPADAGPEISDSFLDRLEIYLRTIAVPVARGLDKPEVAGGLERFKEFGCAGCHFPTLKTAIDAPLPELASQTFHPFTDLLVHDMGEGLADHRPDGSASGSEWRTPPLWGIGLVGKVNRHDRFLHDGRARGFAEAILWHGGEAMSAREAFRNASKADRDALIAFLNAL